MTSISEAIFKGQIRTRETASPNSPKRDQTIMTSQLLARRAVEAVLAGGYSRCEDAPQHPATPRERRSPDRRIFASPHEAEGKARAVKGIIRYLLLWLGVFVLAGAIAIGTSRLPGHAVQAKPAERSALTTAVEEIKTESGMVEESAAAAPDISVAAIIPSLPSPSTPSTPKNIALLAPVARLQPAASRLGIPDDHPLGKSGLAVEEVLYEGEPAAQAAVEPEPRDHSRPLPLPLAVKPAPAPRGNAPSSQPAVKRIDTPKVEGIFWDKIRPMAIVNGDIVEVGAQVGPYKVVEIKPGVVTLADGATRLALRP